MQEPTTLGKFKTTTGVEGFFGAAMITVADGERLLRAQFLTVSEQNARSRLPSRVTLLPGTRRLPDVDPKVTVTTDAVVHAQVERDALMNENSWLHGHVAVIMPAESVGVSKVIRTA